MIVGLDLDGVIRDFLGALRKQYKKIYPDHEIKPVTRWGLHEFFPIGDKIYDFIWEEYAKECLCNAEPFPGAIGFIEYLNYHSYEICIITAQPTWQAKKCTFDWLVKNDILELVNHVAILEPHLKMKKGFVRVDIILEDAPHHLKYSKDGGLITVCYDQMWNQGCESDYRVKSYEEFIELLGKLSREL